jgi:hypothetical protein
LDHAVKLSALSNFVILTLLHAIPTKCEFKLLHFSNVAVSNVKYHGVHASSNLAYHLSICELLYTVPFHHTRLVAPLNILLEFVTPFTLNLLDAYTLTKLLHPLNIYDVFVTLLVSHHHISKLVILLNPLNILFESSFRYIIFAFV